MKTPEKINVHDTFDGSVRYSAPVYQRYYVWGNEPLQALLEDIETAGDGNLEQFIGATVVQDFGKKGGNQSPNEYLMIDGQQRLTTIYMLICGLAWSYLQGGKDEEALTLAQTYLSFSAGKYAGMPKLLPTVQDRRQLFDILQEDIPCIEWSLKGESIDEHSSRNGISQQWENIKNHFAEVFFSDKGRLLTKKIEPFQESLLNKIVFIQVTLEATDDANTVFSKLNYEGVKLSLSDLVRNEVISRVPDNCKDALDRFYETTWKPFEKAFPTNSFDQFITIYSFIKFKGHVSKSRAFPELQKAWIGTKPNIIVSDMDIYADLYCALVKYNPLKNIHIDVGERVRRFSLMPKTTVTWPYIIELLNAFRNGLAGKADTLKCLQIVESFLVRRAIVGLEPTGLHAVFKGLWVKAGADPVKLKEKIVTGTIRCPNNQTITETLSTGDMYSRKITKYLLTQREIHFNLENGYDNATDDFTVEHVLPQNLTKEWALTFTKEEHKALLHTIGNLVPLTKGQNGRVKDQDWISKKSFIKGSNWKITQTAAAVKSWDKSQILKRAKAFASWAVEEWPDVQ
ncbi:MULTISPECIES: DUF262 domain-containing protein [Pseudomonas syringae group]|uniref:DUF262 domain-containing protein n=1 Tax=Pseudomonas syringae pv. ribicola TaxID=55398 RepID=A0A0P9Z4Q1_PSESI|nr:MULTISPECIES: DUF262 domain-containing protein [Pseudomonas syringae group]EKN48125.1 hypothetical protein AAI_03181 [Pseudomonas viridiflava UASWS0038]KPY44611.1 Uncharacterized protein ALO47_00018 [Pseudomonas syringae pv. ribicola]KPZ23002.1 Uncharacterized protein ALO56_02249 [Pseudomonas viridiflava]